MQEDEENERQEFLASAQPHLSNIFDETQLDFRLHTQSGDHVGLPTEVFQSSALLAQATFRDSGEPVPLKCQWYHVPSGDEIEVSERQLQPIDHATGSCFQPSLADVGKKICVHAIPVCKD